MDNPTPESSSAWKSWGPLLAAILVSLAGLLAISAMTGWKIPDRPNKHGYAHAFAFRLLPLPFAFLLWLKTIQRINPIKLKFSFVWLAASVSGFVLVALLKGHPYLRMACCTLAATCGLFVLVPFSEALKRAWENRRLTGIAIILSMTMISFRFLYWKFWLPLCYATAIGMLPVVRLFDSGVRMKIARAAGSNNVRIHVTSPGVYTIDVFAPCSGLEGIFLYLFLTCSLLIIQWEIFSKWRIHRLFAFSVIYVYCINVLRISLIFLLGVWAHSHDSPMALSMRGWPMQAAHSYAGFIIYLVAFDVFMRYVYRIVRIERRALPDKPT